MTNRQAEVLRLMRDTDEELVYERGCGYLGLERVAARTVFALLRLMAIRTVGGSPGELERYVINETGLELLRIHKRAVRSKR